MEHADTATLAAYSIAPRRAALIMALGLAIAFVGAVCGIGGGLFAVPVLHYLFKLPLRSSVATSLCLVAANALASTASELLHEQGAFLWDVVLPLMGGALVGAQFGYVASKKLSESVVKALFAVVLVAAGIRLVSSSGTVQELEAFRASYSVGHAGLVACIGVLAGTVAPLLGIGGGLIVVPALLIFFPDIGSLGARAASLGVACVTSLRSIHLYWGERSINTQVAPWFVAGALIGATAGVQAVHLPGIAGVARQALGGILLVTAIRFAMDVRRLRPQA